MENTYVFLDGGYLSKISKHFGKGNPLKYDIKQFANTLAKEKGLWCKKTFFYIAPPYQSPTHPKLDDIEKTKRHNFWIKKISSIPDLKVRQGRCQKDDDGDFHQKGVDTLLTMDLFSLQDNEDDIKTIIILICDTDFVPILQEIRKKYKIKIIVAYYSDFVRGSPFSMSNHLWNSCDDNLLITPEHFKASYRETNKVA
ncbi:NYN domain-containing protein [Candidatus Pacearchaeota archaeon]|nr:NYN domain-containing protein [Candidatus Pacearchaeota archaeon]